MKPAVGLSENGHTRDTHRTRRVSLKVIGKAQQLCTATHQTNTNEEGRRASNNTALSSRVISQHVKLDARWLPRNVQYRVGPTITTIPRYTTPACATKPSACPVIVCRRLTHLHGQQPPFEGFQRTVRALGDHLEVPCWISVARYPHVHIGKLNVANQSMLNSIGNDSPAKPMAESQAFMSLADIGNSGHELIQWAC
jgi:hypothetical protein